MGNRKHMKNIRECLISVMKEKDWSITDLSIMCDLSYHAMCNIVNGVTNDINLSTVEKISFNIGLPIERLIGTGKTDSEEEKYKNAISKAIETLEPYVTRKAVLWYE